MKPNRNRAFVSCGYQDGPAFRATPIRVEYAGPKLSPSALADKLRGIIREYVNTPNGRRAYAEANEDFNWGDAANEIPAAFWRARGIYVFDMEPADDAGLDHDERFEPHDGCDGSGIRPGSPAHSGLPVPKGYVVVERCDECDQYASDREAAAAYGTDVQERNTGKGCHDTICRPKVKAAKRRK